MRRPLAIAVTITIGCGTRSAPAPTLSNKAPATMAGPSCKDAGVILRARVGDEQTAGPDKEATITGACELDHWPIEVITCVTSNPRPRNCLDNLTEAARTSYDAKLEAWAAKWSEDLDQGDSPQEAALSQEIQCPSAIGDAATFAPEVTLTGDDREFVVRMRHDTLVKECDAGWSEPVKECLVAAINPAATATCLTSLEPQQSQDLATRLVALDALMAKTIAARAKAPDCKKIVAVHYADAAWKSKVDSVKGGDRKKMIDASRKAMTDVCTKEAWSPTVRACVSSGGAGDCFAGNFAWGFPARGVIVPTGIAECDAYIAAIQSYATCAKLPQDARDAITQSIDMATQALIEMTADPSKRQEAEDGCRSGAEAVKQSLSSMGC